jgi:signal transduction histidine kinase
VALCGLAAGIGVSIMRLGALPHWLRVRMCIALGLLALAASLDPAAHTSLAVAVAALTGGLAGAVLLAGGCAAVLQHELVQGRTRVAGLEAELARLEVGVRADRARFHEIDSTVAGIASASRLIHESPDLSESRRDVLSGMMASEVERLHRMMAARSADRRRRVDLDDVIGHIVVSHRAQGRTVRWTPSGLFAHGRADDIAEVIDTLLQNAARHGSPDQILVTVAGRGADVEIAVSDEGPGITPPLRGRVFDWGVHGPLSPGEGIGLCVARDLARGLGGDLLVDDVPRGARFVFCLPAAPVTGEEVSSAGAFHVAS